MYCWRYKYFFGAFLALIFYWLLIDNISYSKIYKWVDYKGVVHFSDRQPLRDVKKIEILETSPRIKKSLSMIQIYGNANERG